MYMGNQTAPKSKLRKGLWSPEEDEKLVRYITKYGHKCWSIVPKQAGLQRCGKSCRLRWINYLRPDLKRGHFTQEEEDLIVKLHAMLGNRWAQIATQLPGRTDNEIKNFWNSCLRKKLRQVGIDPQTHKPLHIAAKLDTSTTKFAGEVLQKDEEDLKPNISKNPWQFQAAPVETSKETFTMSMLPVTVSPYARNLPIMGYTDLGSFNFKMEESPTYTSNVTNNSNSVSFSPLEEQQQASSTETVCSETIDTFPFWEVCSGESVSEKVRGSGDSWELCDPLFKWSVVNSSILDHNKDDITWQHRSLAEFYDDESAVSDPIFDNM